MPGRSFRWTRSDQFTSAYANTFVLQITVESDGKNASTKVRINILEPPSTEAAATETEAVPVSTGSEKPEAEEETGPEVEVVEDEAVDESTRSDNFAFSVRENVGGENHPGVGLLYVVAFVVVDDVVH